MKGSQIERIKDVSPYVRPMAKEANALIDLHNRGYAIDSQTIEARRLPDGRIGFYLKNVAATP
jgi:hypothetical protein